MKKQILELLLYFVWAAIGLFVYPFNFTYEVISIDAGMLILVLDFIVFYYLKKKYFT